MAVLAAQDVAVSGLADVVFTAADVAGDEAPCGRGLVLLVRNGDASPHTLTVTTPGTVKGIPIDDVDVVIAAGDIAAVALDALAYRDPSTLRAALAYDAVTDVTVAVLQLPQ